MIRTPVFKANLHVDIVPDGGVVVLSDDSVKSLRGHVYELLAPLIDGRRDADAIVDALAGHVDAAKVYYALDRLKRNGHIAESTPEIAPETAAFWHGSDVEPRGAIEALCTARVRVRAVAETDRTPFSRALAELGIPLGENGESDIDVVVVDDYLRSELEAYNRESLNRDRPWLLVKPFGCTLWVGPLFRPGKTACWSCLAERLRGNRPVETLARNHRGAAGQLAVARGLTPATLQMAGSLVATEVANWLARGRKSQLEGKLLTLDVRSWRSDTHTVVRLPECADCGRPEQCLDRIPQPLVLESRKKTFTSDGGHRIRPPHETFTRFQHHISPITGVVRHLDPYGSAGDGVLHVYGASHAHARRARSLREVRAHLRNGCSGKGATDAQAKSSGLCEALERFSGLFRGTEPRRRARMAELGDAAIHPNDCMLYSDRQYAERDAWNARRSHWNYVPIVFNEKEAIDWTPVWSLTRRRVRYLPTEFCYFDYPSPPEDRICVGCSNGNAAGNTIEEAILQGVLELVERDAVALWWYNRLRRPAVDPYSFGESYIFHIADFLARRQRNLWALDLTMDLGIPVFVALSRRTNAADERIILGLGAHLDPRIALLRAVTEMNQMLVWSREMEFEMPPLSATDDAELLDWIRHATVADHPYLLPQQDTAPRRAPDYPSACSDDLRDDVLRCQRLLEERGMEMLVLDQTRSDIGLSVVKVVVPGLRHFWARFAPGRLYEVPVRLGWLPHPLTEEQLNPITMFL